MCSLRLFSFDPIGLPPQSSFLTIVAIAQLANPLPAGSQNAASPQNPAASSQNDPLVVRTTAGLIRGMARPNGGAQFRGIPYAEPPVGPLRWHVPVPKEPWSGVRDANAYGSACSQPLLGGAWNRYDAEHSSEDCLYLNVDTPTWPAQKPLPVMFGIHGGANAGGSGSGGLYNDGTLTQHGVVLRQHQLSPGHLRLFCASRTHARIAAPRVR